MSENRYYLTIAADPNDARKLMAVISLGSPQRGDQNITVCDVTSVATRKAAMRWFKEQLKTRPWEPRQ